MKFIILKSLKNFIGRKSTKSTRVQMGTLSLAAIAAIPGAFIAGKNTGLSNKLDHSHNYFYEKMGFIDRDIFIFS